MSEFPILTKMNEISKEINWNRQKSIEITG